MSDKKDAAVRQLHSLGYQWIGGQWVPDSPVSTPEGYTSDGWADVAQGLPEPQMPVLLDVGGKYPLRAMWVEPKTLELGIDQDETAGEYDEATDTYYCHSGWYEWNQHDEVNWRVTATPLRWMHLPITNGDKP